MSGKKSDTARTNGSKSHGPVTPEGRATSSRNSTRHGLTAKTLILPGESYEDFQQLLADYVDQFKPQTNVEMDLVESMAVTQWRLRRLSVIESNLFTNEITHRANYSDNFEALEPGSQFAYAFQAVGENGRGLALLIRYEGHLTRTYDCAFKQLQILQCGL